MNELVKRATRQLLPTPAWHRLRAYWRGQEYCPPAGWARFGNLHRVEPISRAFGKDRGLPIDRYYIEHFLSRHAADIRAHVLEIQDNVYTHKLGGNRVTTSDVLHLIPGNPKATIVADLTSADDISSNSFDCIILTQTLQCIYDVRAALKTLSRVLKPDGVLLATVGGISQISRWDMDRWGHYWNFTSLSIRRLLEESFPAAEYEIESHGNVLAATAFLQGLAAQELSDNELDHHDPDYELVITARVAKSRTVVS